ncbi:MAG: ATP-binding cassette domain-containing protein [Chloroflexi bacterium]|nr:ATP-binding cassette domain-containing protein [Chloroflexota bacterium]MDA1270844.1 ATP-binding cassette domain-containing protein [Chloroflexota bacterium]
MKESKGKMLEPPLAAPPIVDGIGIAKSFGGLTALAPLDITIAPGERVALAGPSGSGKTTLLYILAGLLAPDNGELFLDSKRIGKMRPGKELAQTVGLVQQQFDLVPHLPVVQNVLAGRLGHWGLLRSLASLFSARERPAVLEALSRLGIADKIDERTSQLSGGEQQRVAIARLMLQSPRIILADEPVSSLDPARAEEILRILTELADGSGQTIIASLHAPDLIRRYFSRVIGLRNGKLRFDIPAPELTPKMLDALYDLDRDPQS